MNITQSAAQTATLPILLRQRPTLTQALSPRTVVVVGAEDPHGIGRAMLANLLAGAFAGTVTPIAAGSATLLGVHTAPSLTACAPPIDLVVAAIPPAQIPALLADCIRAGVKGVILSPAEHGAHDLDGESIPRAAIRAAQEAGIQVIGPNSLGVITPQVRLHAACTTAMPLVGPLAIIGQSGGLVSALVDHACREAIGLSGVIALGAMTDVGWADAIDHFGDDPQTKAIILCIEDMGDPASFLSAVREVSATMPIVAIKTRHGDHRSNYQSATFTDDEVMDALFARAGILRVDGFSDLFAIADLLAAHPRPTGRRLAIVSCTHGVGLITAEATIRGGGQVARPHPRSDSAPTAIVDHDHLVRLVDRAGTGLEKEVAGALQDPYCDGVLVVLTPSGIGHPTQAATALADLRGNTSKPLLASWMGGTSMEPGRKRLARAGIPVFAYPDLAARAWNALGRHRDLVTALYETPIPACEDGRQTPDHAGAQTIIERNLGEDRLTLSDHEALRLLQAYHLPVAIPSIATSHDEAIAEATANGYPVEVESWPARRPDGGGPSSFRFTVEDDDSLRAAFHAIRDATQKVRGSDSFMGVTVRNGGSTRHGRRTAVSMAIDQRLGQVIGVHEYGLTSGRTGWTCGLPPLSGTHARQLLDRACIERINDTPAGGAALDQLLINFSRLVVEQRRIKSAELDVAVNHRGEPVVLSAQIVLHERALIDGQLPRTAIRPYPGEYRTQTTLDDGTELVLRPIAPTDEPALALMHEGLSERSVHARYFSDLPLPQRIAHGRLSRICHADYARQIALVVEHCVAGLGNEMIAVGRLNRLRNSDHAELALLVADRWQHRGIGEHLMRTLLDVARREGITQVSARFLIESQAMRSLCTHHGFTIHHQADDQFAHAQLTL